MKRFKVGDHVRGAAGSQGKYTQPGELLEAVVADLNPDGDIRIRVLKHAKFDAREMPEFEVSIGEIELIEKGERPCHLPQKSWRQCGLRMKR
ncbi:MAG: hypothetical protein KIC46_04965 [Clostridiales bacterium]|nr:hypothetical protein [Clostridiales bacterium]